MTTPPPQKVTPSPAPPAAGDAALRAELERRTLALRGAREGIFDWDLQANTVHLSARAAELLGLEPQPREIGPAEWLERVAPEDRAALHQATSAHLRGDAERVNVEHRVAHDEQRWVLARGQAVKGEHGRPVRLAGTLADVTEARTAVARLEHHALHDPLTGLPNRVLLLDRLEQALRRGRRRERQPACALLFLDLDRFKVVNDSLGHAAGDTLQQAVARRLQGVLRPEDTVARLGGDEFCILLEEIDDAHEATRVAERVQQALTPPIRVEGREVVTSASVGVALAQPGSRPQELLDQADTAMYRAKAAGKARHAVFDDGMHAQVMARLDLESALRAAIENGVLAVRYQPVFHTATGRVTGFEALCRWPDGVAPAAFLAVAEETGLIVPLGRLVLEDACARAAAWRALPGGADLTVSVNVSPRELSEPGFLDGLGAVLAATGLDPAALRLEVTEGAVAHDPELVRRTLTQALERHGVRSQLDDFGTASSSLRLLHSFPGDAVKIDAAFVRAMDADAGAFELVKAMIALAHNLGLEAIAEGVETQAHLDALELLGCERVQGFLLAPPLAPAEAGALLTSPAAGPVG